MNDIKLSAGLFNQLGGTLYLSRPAYFQKAVSLKESAEPSKKDSGLSDVIDLAGLKINIESQPEPLVSEKTPDLPSKIERVSEGAVLTKPVVIIGSGLSSIWEDESKLEWQLLQNICLALDWPEESLSFFDTDLLISEEAVFTTMEEVIDLGVEWVLSMDSEHPVSEQLAEGIQVIEVPDFDQMLSDPYAKQSFYQSVVPLLKRS
jgi:hypothetical protein